LRRTHDQHQHVSPLPREQNTARAFTLIEVLVSVAIIALLVSIMLPSLARARATARTTVCLSQLRQMALAGQSYASSSLAFYPPSLDTVYTPEFQTTQYQRKIEYAWDYTRISGPNGADEQILPGLLWQGKTLPQIQQCPMFEGAANWAGSTDREDPFTGYNYNSSYVGAFRRTRKGITVSPARQDQIRRPERCALFGDGEYTEGANKFMRSPWGAEQGARDTDVMAPQRSAGTQGYRHLRKTNLSFADGHGESRLLRFTETYAFVKDFIPAHCGFLSADNSLYSLDGTSPVQTASR